MYFYESFSFAMRKVVVPLAMHGEQRVNEILMEAETVYLKAFEHQTLSDAKPLTYLSHLACWLADESKKSPTGGKQMKRNLCWSTNNNCNHLWWWQNSAICETRRIPGMRLPNRNRFLRDVMLCNTAGLKNNHGSLTLSGKKTIFVYAISISLLSEILSFYDSLKESI